MRLLITGMGGELGTRVARRVDDRDDIASVLGLDVDPPRRQLRRVEFHRVDPRNRARSAELVTEFAPTHVLHLGIYEPNARSGPRAAVARTAAGSISVLDAAAATGALEAVVMRSGIEVYGRRRGAPVRPDEDVPIDPTSFFGHSLQHAERQAERVGAEAGVPVTLVRCAPIVGPHFPSPLGRYLRHPVVPFSPLSDGRFSLLHQEDAAEGLLAALRAGHDGPVNLVGPGAVTVRQAAMIGHRVPLPVVGPGWQLARVVSELLGAPVPDHLRELLVRGRTADGSRSGALVGFRPAHRTHAVVEQLYEWSEITYLPTGTIRGSVA